MGLHHHDSDRACFGLAVANLLRERHPFHTAKLVARDLRCTVKAAENLLAGHLSAKSITRLVATYGFGFLIDAGAELTGTTLHDYIIEQKDKAAHEARTWEEQRRRYDALSAALRHSPPEDGCRPG